MNENELAKKRLYYFNARDYDATIGRFINVDPIQDGLNWYVAFGNNPLNKVDPTGLEEKEITISKNDHENRNDKQKGYAPPNEKAMNILSELGLFEKEKAPACHNMTVQTDNPKGRENAVIETVKGNIFGYKGDNNGYRGSEDSVFKGMQFVYDKNGEILTDSLNRGTYDYGKAGTSDHVKKDVDPWIKSGNGNRIETPQATVMPPELWKDINAIYNNYKNGSYGKTEARDFINNYVKEFNQNQ